MRTNSRLFITSIMGACLLLMGLPRIYAAESGQPDQDFAKEAANGGMAEVQLGNYAEQNASNDKVKNFGKHMVEDHSKANNKLMAIAKEKNMALPTAIEGKAKDKADKLMQLKGADFDRAYMQAMVEDHHEDIALFEREAKEGQDADLKKFAEETLPTLKKHLNMAMKAAAAVGAPSAKD